jgi:DNA-binding MarR family transcriptional regulator
MDDAPAAAPARLAAELRASVGALVRTTRVIDRLAPIPGAVLDLLDLRGALTTAELAASRGVRHQTMAATVKELLDAGLLATRTDPADGRKKLLTLTAAGQEALDADRRERVLLLAQALTTLGPDEQRVLAQALALVDRLTAAIAETTAADAGAHGGIGRGLLTGAW